VYKGHKKTSGDKASEGLFRVLHSRPSFGWGGEGGDEGRDSLEMRKRKKTKDLMLGGV